MCKKINQRSHAKSLAVFALAFSLGILINFFSGNYTVRFDVTESFTNAEVKALQNKRVEDKCFNKKTLSKGTIRGSSWFLGSRNVRIRFDQPLNGKYNDLGYDIETYRKCISEIK